MSIRFVPAFLLTAILCGCDSPGESMINPSGSTRWRKPGVPGLDSGYCNYVGKLFLLWATDGRGGGGGTAYTREAGTQSDGHVNFDNGRTIAFSCRFPDERTGKVTIDGTEFDVARGRVFLMKFEGDKFAVKQVDKDLSTIKLDAADFGAIGRADPTIRSFFEPAAGQ
jgi:hypothetical protein